MGDIDREYVAQVVHGLAYGDDDDERGWRNAVYDVSRRTEHRIMLGGNGPTIYLILRVDDEGDLREAVYTDSDEGECEIWSGTDAWDACVSIAEVLQ